MKAKCLTEDQARLIYKKVETDNTINIETMKQDIEDDKMERNKLKEEDTNRTNSYQVVMLNKINKDDIKTEQMIY